MKVTMNQIKAIVKRDVKLNVRTIRFLVVFVLLEFLIPFIFSRIPSFKGRQCAYYSVIVLNAVLSRNVITNAVEERAKQFKQIFKLMGLSDFAYTCGTFISNMILILLGITSLILGNLIFNFDYITSKEVGHFLGASIFTCLSIMALNSIISLALSNPKTAADVSGIYLFSITFM